MTYDVETIRNRRMRVVILLLSALAAFSFARVVVLVMGGGP